MKKIPLTQGKFALVDDEDYEWLSQWKWRVISDGYAGRAAPDKERGIKLTTIFMHREILNVPKGKYTDHINGNKFDNRKGNIRICTQSQNQANRGRQKNNTSGYKGVSWDKTNKKWTAQILCSKEKISIGYFKDPIFAASAYNEAAKRYFGEFARLNEYSPEMVWT